MQQWTGGYFEYFSMLSNTLSSCVHLNSSKSHFHGRSSSYLHNKVGHCNILFFFWGLRSVKRECLEIYQRCRPFNLWGRRRGGEMRWLRVFLSQVLVYALRMNNDVLVRVIFHHTFSRCHPGNVFSDFCVWAWMRQLLIQSQESMGLDSDRSCEVSRSALVGLQQRGKCNMSTNEYGY